MYKIKRVFIGDSYFMEFHRSSEFHSVRVWHFSLLKVPSVVIKEQEQKNNSVCLAFMSPYQIVASETVFDLFNLVCFEIPTIFFCTNWILMESSTCGNLLYDSSLYFIYVLVVSWKSSLTYSSKDSFRILRNASHILHITSM